jgi:hypothetical protein
VLGAGDNDFSYIDINGSLWLITRNNWYMRGLVEYGIEPGYIHPGYILDDEPSDPFTMDQCWATIDKVVADGEVPAPDSWDAGIVKALYSLFVQRGHAYADPNIFGYNDPYTDGASKVWVTANSDLAGGIETFAHEMIEGSTGKQIADSKALGGPCGENVVLDHLRLPSYWSEKLGACWPTEHAVFLAESFHTSDISAFEEFHPLVK